MRHLRRVLARLRRARERLNLGRKTVRLRKLRRRRNDRKRSRKEAWARRARKEKELAELIKVGREEGDRGVKLAEQIEHLDHRIGSLRSSQRKLTKRVRALHEERADAKKRRGVLEQKRQRILKRMQEIRQQRQQKPPIGTGPWGGSMSVIEREVVPVYSRFGVPVTSRKRTVTLGNPSSDHYVGNTTAYAADGGTFSGAACAHAVAQSLGISGYSTGNYNNYYITRSGKRFRIQILWAVPGHYNHIHTGCRLV
jgi:hypothetical protein